MGWNYPEISLEDMMTLIKGFVDILILSSGYQSSGLRAHWDAHNIKKALQWGLFFENVLRFLSSSDLFRGSLKELDAALCEMTSYPSFPQGLAHLSVATLMKARDFVSDHLINNLSLMDEHLGAFLMATIEMDLRELSEMDHDCINLYLKKLILLDTSPNSVSDRRGSVKDSLISCPEISTNMRIEKCNGGDFTKFTIQELLKRQSAVSCISKAETGLSILSDAIRCSTWTESDNSLPDNQLKHDRAPAIEGVSLLTRKAEQWVDIFTWNRWKLRSLSYFLDKRTVRLVSGSSLIFSAPKIQWMQLFGRLNSSAESNGGELHEKIEILLLGCIASRWSDLIKHFMSVSYHLLTISKQYHELCNLLTGKCSDCKEENMNSEECGIFEYLAELLGGKHHQLWKFCPALLAAAIPTWSPLFRLYLSEIGTRFKVDYSPMSCDQDEMGQSNCDLNEKIWCLYIFHVCGSHLMRKS